MTPQRRVLDPQLERKDVHVWFSRLDGSLQDVRDVLSGDELDRAGRFHFERDRDRFAVGRATLRHLLAGYVGRVAGEIRFSYSPYGKPRLSGRNLISFNVSHSADRAVFAIAPGVPVGVDIEVLDSKQSDELVARQFFSRREVGEFLALPAEARPRTFLTCWTRKEAYIKARGEGLSLPLQDFDVSLTPGVAPALRRTAWSATEPAEWLLFDLTAACPGCVAALAVQSDAADVHLGEVVLGRTGLERRALSGTFPFADVATQP